MNPPDSVLVLRFSALGDVILTSPAIDALRTAWPKTKIFYAVKSNLAHLVQHNPCIDQVIGLEPGEGILHFRNRLRALNYGALLDLHAKIRSRLLRAMLPRTRSSIWHKRDFSETLAVKLALRPYHAATHLSQRFHAAVEALVGDSLPLGRLRYYLGPADQRIPDHALAQAGVELAKPILGMSPGANWETKRWPAERFGDLASRALASRLQVVVAGSAKGSRQGHEIVRVAPSAADLSGKLDIKRLGGFISRCTAFVANDSGPMHMARALRVPTLAFFGSTDPGMFDFEGHAFAFAGVPGAPCSFFGRPRCPPGHFRALLYLDSPAPSNSLPPTFTPG